VRSTERLQLALAVAMLASASALVPLTLDRSYLWLTAGLVGSSIVFSAIARRLGGPDLVARLVGLVPGLVVVGLALPRFPELLPETAEYIRVSWAPMSPHDGVALLSTLLLWVLYVVVEATTVGLARPGWTFPVLVVPYLVPALVLPGETSAALFVPIALGYLGVLATDTYNRHRDSAAPLAAGLRRGIAFSTALAGVIALVATAVVTALVPVRTAGVLGNTGDDGPVQLGDPSLDLRANVTSTSNKVIITYTPEDGDGHYLRLTALPEFDAQGFHLTPTDLLSPPLPDPDGPDGRTLTRTRISVGQFASEWLPVPWAPRSVDVVGDWRYDPRTWGVVAVGDDRKEATLDLDYRVTSWEVEPSREQIEEADAGDPGDNGLTLALPAGLSPDLGGLVDQLVDPSMTDGQQALALQGWLLSENFSYSTQVPAGSSLDTLNNFLLFDRTGYCEQFAGGLATLARLAGIPSRVVVGFLPGSRKGDDWEVSVRQMHAWTELYLDGLGWVRFDATPGAGSQASPSARPTPTRTSASPSASATPTASAAPGAGGGAAQWGRWLGVAGGALGWLAVVAALLAAPLLVRSGLRARRLGVVRPPALAAAAAWDEARDSVLDAGLAWPGGTPRQVAAALAPELDAAAAADLAALAAMVDLVRYGPGPATDDPVAAVRRFRAALVMRLRGQSGWHRLVPRSLLRWPRDWARGRG
jgi:transglutaminase-like putative cysteine protease